MNIIPYDIEVLLIGTSLRYGNDAVKLVLPQLTSDRFVYSKTGKLGFQDHRNIWRAIEQTFLVDKKPVNIPNILFNFHDNSEDTQLYLQALTGMVVDRFHIYGVEAETIKNWAEVIDKVGGVYSLKSVASKLSENLIDQDRFEHEVMQIKDLDQWANDQLTFFRYYLKPDSKGLQHISIPANNVLEMWGRKRRGEQTTFLPSGMPSVIGAGLFAAGNLTVVHGLSGAGKSAFVHQEDLGIAIGLKELNIPGCVAVFSLEMPQERLVERYAALLAGFNTSKLNYQDKIYSDEDYDRLTKWLEYVTTLPIYIEPTNILTTSAAKYSTEGLHISEAGPVRKISIDYLELLADDTEETKELKLDHVIHESLHLARLTGANVTTISQTTYAGGTIYPAGPGGPRYSRAIQHAADDIVEVWNVPYMKDAGIKYAQLDGVSEQHVTFFVQKCRYGSIGSFRLNWEPTCTRFTDPLLGGEIVFDHFKDNRLAVAKGVAPSGHSVPIEDEEDF